MYQNWRYFSKPKLEVVREPKAELPVIQNWAIIKIPKLNIKSTFIWRRLIQTLNLVIIFHLWTDAFGSYSKADVLMQKCTLQVLWNPEICFTLVWELFSLWLYGGLFVSMEFCCIFILTACKRCSTCGKLVMLFETMHSSCYAEHTGVLETFITRTILLGLCGTVIFVWANF